MLPKWRIFAKSDQIGYMSANWCLLQLYRVELMAFLVAYFFLSLLYRQCLIFDPVHKEYFELICIYASR